MSFDIDKDTLQSIDPNFRLSYIKIYFSDKVLKVGQRNSLQERTFVISTQGIFLLRKKAFGSIKVVCVISYIDITSIHVAGSVGSFSSKQSSIRIKDKRIGSLAFLVYFIRQTQFPTSILPLAIQFPPDGQYSVKAGSIPYSPEYILGDRLISCALHYQLCLNEDDIKPYFQRNILLYHTFTITSALLREKFFPALVFALSFEEELKILHLKGIKVSNWLLHSDALIMFNRFVQCLVFDDCDFSDISPNLSNVLLQGHSFKPYRIRFINCKCIDSSFSNFFDKLGTLAPSIISLEIDKCHFNQDSLSLMFQSIFFNDCFHAIQEFHFVSLIEDPDITNQIINLAGCSWVLLTKCLHTICVLNSGLEISSLMKSILGFETGLRVIDFSNNRFISQIEFDSFPTSSLSFLDISGSHCNYASLNSLFVIIESKKLKLKGIGLSSLTLSPSDFDDFTILLSNTKVTSMESIYFDNNPMNSTQTKRFSSFISKQTTLKLLSISSSIDITETSSGLTELYSILETLPLEYLIIKSDGSLSYSYGPFILPLIKSLYHNRRIKYLDLTNQMIGVDGLDALSRLLSTDIEWLLFDGCRSSSNSVLLDFCKKVVSSNLKYVSWPKQEIKQAKKRLHPSESLPDFCSFTKKMKHEFNKRFGNQYYNELSIKYSIIDTLFKGLNSETKRENCTNEILIQNLLPSKELQVFLSIPDPIQSFFNECIELGSQKGYNPVLDYLDQITTTYSIQNLIENHPIKKQ